MVLNSMFTENSKPDQVIRALRVCSILSPFIVLLYFMDGLDLNDIGIWQITRLLLGEAHGEYETEDDKVPGIATNNACKKIVDTYIHSEKWLSPRRLTAPSLN